jgi:hypothetical protein
MFGRECRWKACRGEQGVLASVGKRKQRGKSSKKGKIKEVLTEIRYYF